MHFISPSSAYIVTWVCHTVACYRWLAPQLLFLYGRENPVEAFRLPSAG